MNTVTLANLKWIKEGNEFIPSRALEVHPMFGFIYAQGKAHDYLIERFCDQYHLVINPGTWDTRRFRFSRQRDAKEFAAVWERDNQR